MKVGDALDEIEKLDKQSKIINNIINKMSTDEEIADFLYKKLSTDRKSLQEIYNTLISRKCNLDNQLRDLEVDIK